MSDTGKEEKSAVAKDEEEVLQFWNDKNIFEKTLSAREGEKEFVFYDGPPFATGLPHYGHIAPGTIKDVIPRYKTMRGFRVLRQWGWDCHGLPIENIVEKNLGTKTKKEIEEMGVGKFNALCREQIFTYVDAWEKIVPRFGRWADMKNPYRTMDASYMESEWWAFKELYDKGLIYKDYRSMHICPRCETTLAQAEVAEGYQDVKDISVTVRFKVKNPEKLSITKNENADVYILAWTTTPWTLPGNVALAVGSAIEYLVLNNGEEIIIVASEAFARGGFDGYQIQMLQDKQSLKGRDLEGLEYEPLFDSYARDKSLENYENGWKIYAADFVTTEDGTGVVHIAPAFGEDDMNLGKKEKLPFVQHVGMDGVIKSEVKELAGLHVKPKDDVQATDIEVLKYLAGKGLLFAKEKYEHSYPHCWRCDTPLINYATSSWFVAVTKVKDKLLKLSEDMEWSPAHIKEGRWKNWLEGARDWSISRQRFWANTIPVWEDAEGKERLVIGSVEDLKEHTKTSGNTYFVMRHGRAQSNERSTISNQVENEDHVTQEGKKQIKQAAPGLKEKGIDLIYASPFMRTKETAEMVADAIGISKDAIVYDDRLKEVDTGDALNGKPIAEYRAMFPHLIDKFTRAPKGGETLSDMKRRFGAFLYELEGKHEGKRILIVTHEYGAWMLAAAAEGADAKKAVAMRGDREDFLNNAEVMELSFTPLPHNEEYELDLHRPHIDEVEILGTDGARLTRVPDVLDTWFDSGSVSFSPFHYPFEHPDLPEVRIPADFIGEGQDQVSKWFYYQHVLAGALFDKRAFTHVIVNGIVLAEDGKKMSKRLQNYPDPIHVVNKYGADAMRMYLLSSPVVRAENLSFSEDGVGEIARKMIGRLKNVYAFYDLYKGAPHESGAESPHMLDRWIVARVKELHAEATGALDRYELDRAARPIVDFVDDLSTWYIRRSRERFKGGDEEDKKYALGTTRWVLAEYAKIAAPVAPFIAEWLWQRVRSAEEPESVHLALWSEHTLSKDDGETLSQMRRARELVTQALEARASAGIKVRQPLAELAVKGAEFSEELVEILRDEVNVKKVTIKKEGEGITLDTNITEDLKREGYARDIMRHVQDLRKKAGLNPGDRITLGIDTDAEGERVFALFGEEIQKGTNTEKIEKKDLAEEDRVKLPDGISVKTKILS